MLSELGLMLKPPHQPRERSLRWHLTALSIGLLLPTLAFIGVLLWQFSASERKAVEAQARDLSHTIAVALDREINGLLTTLQALSTSPSLQSGDLAAFYRQVQEVSRLQGINISLRGRDGHAYLTTRAPLGTDVAVPAALLAADREVLQSGKAMVSNIFTSSVSSRPVFQVINAPVAVAGTPTYLLAASIDVHYLADAVRRENLPAGWIGTIVDRNGVIVARTERHAELAGTHAAKDYTHHAVGPAGDYYGRNAEGTSVLVGYARSQLTGWTSGANVATALVDAPMRQSLIALAALGLMLGAIALMIGWYTQRLLVGAFDRLIGIAAAVGQGRSTEAIATPIAELNRVGAALREAGEHRMEAEDALHQLTDTLETKVIDRTANLVQAQEQLRHTNQNLEAIVEARIGDLRLANEEIQRFAYIVSHDLRAPLVNVMGFTSELDGMRDDLTAFLAAVEKEAPRLVTKDIRAAVEIDLPEALGFIRSSTGRMDRLIAAILKLSREGRRKLTPEPIEVATLVEAQGKSLSHQLSTGQAELRVADDLPPLVSDRLAVEQIFGNLLDNAVKYLSVGRAGRITVSGRTEGSVTYFEIADNGRGIAAKDLERVFELFRRSGEQDTPGEGIGLAYVRNLARRLGGDVTVSSELGHGSTFTVALPSGEALDGGDRRNDLMPAGVDRE